MIEIQSIEDSSYEDVLNIVLGEKEQPIELYLPKQTVLFSSSDENIAEDYLRISYFGQLLSEVAENLTFEVVSPSEHTSIKFVIHAKNFAKLAQVIYAISHSFNNYFEEDIYCDISEELLSFEDEVLTGKLTPFCEYFFDTYKEFRE